MKQTQTHTLSKLLNKRYPAMACPQLAGLFLDAAIRALEPDQQLQGCAHSLSLVKEELDKLKPKNAEQQSQAEPKLERLH